MTCLRSGVHYNRHKWDEQFRCTECGHFKNIEAVKGRKEDRK